MSKKTTLPLEGDNFKTLSEEQYLELITTQSLAYFQLDTTEEVAHEKLQESVQVHYEIPKP